MPYPYSSAGLDREHSLHYQDPSIVEPTYLLSRSLILCSDLSLGTSQPAVDWFLGRWTWLRGLSPNSNPIPAVAQHLQARHSNFYVVKRYIRHEHEDKCKGICTRPLGALGTTSQTLPVHEEKCKGICILVRPLRVRWVHWVRHLRPYRYTKRSARVFVPVPRVTASQTLLPVCWVHWVPRLNTPLEKCMLHRRRGNREEERK